MASGFVCGVDSGHAALKTGGGGKRSASGQGRPTYIYNSEATMFMDHGTNPLDIQSDKRRSELY